MNFLLLAFTITISFALSASDQRQLLSSSAALPLLEAFSSNPVKKPVASEQKKKSYLFNKTATFQAHSLITDTTWHPDGIRFAIADASREITIWNGKKNKKVVALKSDSQSIVYSPNGTMLASAEVGNDASCRVKIWHSDSIEPASSLHLSNSNWCRAIFDPTSKYLVYARHCPEVAKPFEKLCLFDIESQKNSVSSTDNMVAYDMTWLNATTLVIGEASEPETAIRLYDTRTMQQISSFKADIRRLKNQVACLDENTLICNNTKYLVKRDLRNNKMITVPLKNVDQLLSFDLSNDRKTALIEHIYIPFIGSGASCLKTFDISTGTCITDIAQKDWKFTPYGAIFSPCNKAIIGQPANMTVGLWEEGYSNLIAHYDESEDLSQYPYYLLEDEDQ
jgi:WD40 repeat protein